MYNTYNNCIKITIFCLQCPQSFKIFLRRAVVAERKSDEKINENPKIPGFAPQPSPGNFILSGMVRIALCSCTALPKLGRSVTETFFYFLHIRSSLGWALQVQDRSFGLRIGL
jgi:hypothetical protein